MVCVVHGGIVAAVVVVIAAVVVVAVEVDELEQNLNSKL